MHLIRRTMGLLAASLFGICAYAGEVGHAKLSVAEDTRLTLLSSNQLPDGKLCMAGYSYDAEEAKAVAVGLVIDAKSSKVEWAQILKPAGDLYQNRFTGCFSSGSSVSFIEETDTQSSAELNQVLIHVVAATSPTKFVRRGLWLEGKRNWLVSLSSEVDRTTVVLGHDPGAGAASVEMTVHQMGLATVTETNPVKIRNGSFLPGSKSFFDGQRLLIAGRFAKSGRDSDAAFAEAMISKAGNYIWAKPIGQVAVIGANKQGQLSIATWSNLGKTNIATASEKSSGEWLEAPTQTCVPVALYAGVSVVYRDCDKDTLTIQYLNNAPPRQLKTSLSKLLIGSTVLALYSPIVSGDSGYSIEVIIP
jgi:hypothetical protein